MIQINIKKEVEGKMILPRYFKRNNVCFHINEDKGIYIRVESHEINPDLLLMSSIKVEALRYIQYEMLEEVEEISKNQFRLQLLRAEQNINQVLTK